MKFFLKILLFIFAMLITVGEAKSSTVVSGKRYLRSYTYNLGDAFITNCLNHAITNLVSSGSTVAGKAGMAALSSANFRHTQDWYRRSSGALINVYPEFDLLMIGRMLVTAPLTWLSGLFSKDAAEEGTTVYRAVNAAERASINNSKNFLLKEGGTEVKYFAKTLEDAHTYGKLLYPNGYSVVQGTVAPSVNIGTYWYPFVDGMGAYTFTGNVLPYITPIFP